MLSSPALVHARRAALTLSLVLAMVLLAGCGASTKTVTPSQGYAFWPAYPDEPRIQFLRSYEKSTDIEEKKSNMDELIYGKEPQPVMPLNKPYGVRMWQGKIYVCDLRSNSLTVLDLRNKVTRVLGKTLAQPMVQPSDVTIADDGTKYVSDIQRGAIYVFDAQDRFVTTMGSKDLKPAGMAVYKDELYVANFTSQKIEVYDRRTGEVRRTVGGPGSDDGQFIRPLGVAVDKAGYLYVSDVLKCRVQKFDPTGKLVVAFSGINPSIGGLVRPKHIAVDKEGYIYVVDAAFQNVQLFTEVGQVLTFFGSSGRHPGAMDIPAGIDVHEGDLDLFQPYAHPDFQIERLIIVSNQFGNAKVSVYGLGKLKPGKTVKDIASAQVKILNATTQPDGQRTRAVSATQVAEELGNESGTESSDRKKK